jgi:hypothetical protein
VIRRLLVLCACAAVLAGCRVDLSVDLVIEPDGTGTITFIANADAEMVAAVPTLADELVTDDIVAAGWAIDGPTELPDGGLTITLSHPFSSDQEATNLLNSLGPPFSDMLVTRNSTGEDATNRVSGLLGLPDGFDGFADDELVAAVGSMPFAEEIAASGATPESAIDAVIRVGLPGVVTTGASNGVDLGNNLLEWSVPTDGSVLEMRAVSVQSPGDDRWWARPLSVAALVALVAWVAFMTIFILYVLWARWQRSRRRSRV